MDSSARLRKTPEKEKRKRGDVTRIGDSSNGGSIHFGQLDLHRGVSLTVVARRTRVGAAEAHPV